jgi:hypothetical protein
VVRGSNRHAVAVLALVALIAAMLLPVASNPAGAASPRLRLRPDEGQSGTATLARGRNFLPDASGSMTWEDGTVLAEFTAGEDGRFEVEITIPDAPAGTYEVTATSGDEAGAEAASTSTETAPATPPPFIGSPIPNSAGGGCPTDHARRIDVTNAAELEAALANVQPGDLIQLADGVYDGIFVAERSGTAEARIALCGSRNAVIDGGDFGNGYAFHLTGDYWTIHGITVSNALKGVMLDDASFTLLDQIVVHTIGHEAVHFRTHSTDNVIQDSDIHDTGLKRDKFGEGVYIGSAVSNWERYTDGEPDRSDRNQVLRNRIWNTTSEHIDIKEGTEGGLIEGNSFDGSTLSGADSWVDVKGNGYLIRGNVGVNSPADGFQTHVINDMEWGRDNVFEENVAEVNGDGFGFYIHDAETSNNTVRCSNQVDGAASGFANVECT